MKILEDKENFLTNRREVKIIVEAGKNPTYDEAEIALVKEFNVDKELIVVKGVKGKFGRDTFLISAFVYKSKEDKDNFEVKEEVKAEEKKEEVKAEEKKEEVKEEKKEEVKEENAV